jgi:hypothetical protein
MRFLGCMMGLSLLAFAPLSRGQTLRVQVWSGSTLTSEVDYTASPYNVSVPLTSATTRINFFSVGGGSLADIGAVSFTGPSPSGGVDVVVGTGALTTDPVTNLLNAAQDCAGITFPTSIQPNVRFSGAIAGDLTGPINPNTIVRFEAHGVVSAAISASATSGSSIGYLQVGSTTASGTITAGSGNSGGNIVRIEGESSEGLAGAITALSGSIENLTTPGSIVISASPGIAARDGIGLIQCHDIEGEIIANANGGEGSITQMIINGAYRADLRAKDLLGGGGGTPGLLADNFRTGSMTFDGDVLAAIEAAEPVSNEPTPSPTTAITIHGNLRAGITLKGRVGSLTIDGETAGEAGPITISITPMLTNNQCCLSSIGTLTIGSAPGSTPGAIPLNVVASHVGTLASGPLFANLSGPVSMTGHMAIGSMTVDGDAGGEWKLTSSDHAAITGSLTTTGGSTLGTIGPDQLIRVGGSWSGACRLEGLLGQIVIGAAGCDPSCAAWNADLTVGTIGGDVVLGPSQSQPYEAPHDEALPGDLGGGSIALAAFSLHGKACMPAADASQEQRSFFNSAFCQIEFHYGWCIYGDPGEEYEFAEIDLQFYGPIKAENPDRSVPANNPYQIGRIVNGVPDYSIDYGVYTTYEVRGDTDEGFKRHLVIRGVTFPQLPADHYVIRPKPTSGTRLLCDALVTASPTPVAEFEYDFWLLADCNTNGVEDSQESTGFCCLAWPCDPCMNQDGNRDQDDTAYLVNVVGGGENPTGRDPDFNHDGNADQDDIAALINTLAGAGCP